MPSGTSILKVVSPVHVGIKGYTESPEARSPVELRVLSSIFCWCDCDRVSEINGGLPDDLLQWLRLDFKSCQPVRAIWFASQFNLDVVTGGNNPIEVRRIACVR